MNVAVERTFPSLFIFFDHSGCADCGGRADRGAAGALSDGAFFGVTDNFVVLLLIFFVYLLIFYFVKSCLEVCGHCGAVVVESEHFHGCFTHHVVHLIDDFKLRAFGLLALD